MAALTDYIGLLPSASSAQPKFVAFVSALLQPFVNVQNTVLGFPAAFDIDNAVGVQLDGVGVRVGLSRKLAVPITGVYFALDGNVGPLITGSGATASAQLPSDLDLTKVSIYRDDWQGHTLLSTTPRTNLLLFSDQFDNAAWNKINAAITPNAILAPDGTLTADTVTNNTGALNFARVAQTLAVTNGATYTVPFFMKAGNTNFGVIDTFDTADRIAVFNLVTGTVAVNPTGATASITPAADGWYKCSVTCPVASPNYTATAGPARGIDRQSNPGDYVHIWRAQLELGPVALSGIQTTTAPVTVTDCTISSTGLVTINPTPPVGTNITWLDTRPGVGLDEGVIRGPFDPVDALTSLDDETYRLMLRIKILANNWDGSLEDAQQMLAALQTTGTYLFMQDLFDMSLILGVSGKVPSKLFVSILRQMNDWLRPGAVDSAIRVTSISGAPIFGLDVQNSYIGGLDAGTVAIPY